MSAEEHMLTVTQIVCLVNWGWTNSHFPALAW